MQHQVRDAKERRRFELDVDGHVAFSTYERREGVVSILHTEVPPALGGRGVGSALARGLLDLIRAEGSKVEPLCPFVKAYIGKHAEYADMVA